MGSGHITELHAIVQTKIEKGSQGADKASRTDKGMGHAEQQTPTAVPPPKSPLLKYIAQ